LIACLLRGFSAPAPTATSPASAGSWAGLLLKLIASSPWRRAAAAGGVISTADDFAAWVQALVAGRVFNVAYQRRWLDSLQPEDPSKPDGQQYGYGVSRLRWVPNAIYFHGGETPGYNSKISYDPANDMTLIVWTNLPVSLDGQQTANTLWVKVLDQIYVQSPLR
jgi:D-alanyl-D-alanine carboxypeptidase